MLTPSEIVRIVQSSCIGKWFWNFANAPSTQKELNMCRADGQIEVHFASEVGKGG